MAFKLTATFKFMKTDSRWLYRDKIGLSLHQLTKKDNIRIISRVWR